MVNKRYRAFTSITAILVATVAISINITTSENAFASYDVSQAAAVSDECLNPIFDSNTIDNAVGIGNCAGTVSQQDESGSASAPITSQNANPTIELQRATTTQPPLTDTPPETCVDCFNVLTDDQKSAFEMQLAQTTFPVPPFTGTGAVSTIEELCEQWKEFSNEEREDVINILGPVLDGSGIFSGTVDAILECLLHSVG